MNINATFRVSINSGAALILFLLAFFLLLAGVAFFPAVEKNFIAAGALLMAALERYMNKRKDNNKLALESEKLNCDPGKGAAHG
jgi:hypothetical protein